MDNRGGHGERRERAKKWHSCEKDFIPKTGGISQLKIPKTPEIHKSNMETLQEKWETMTFFKRQER